MLPGRGIVLGFMFLLFAVPTILYFQTMAAEKIVYEGNFEDDCNLEDGKVLGKYKVHILT